MADISSYLQKIMEAIYGEEVRGSIHNALAAMNRESSSAMEFAATAKDSAAASAEKAKTEADTATKKAAEALDSAGKAALSESAAKASETLTKQYSDDASRAPYGPMSPRAIERAVEAVGVRAGERRRIHPHMKAGIRLGMIRPKWMSALIDQPKHI